VCYGITISFVNTGDTFCHCVDIFFDSHRVFQGGHSKGYEKDAHLFLCILAGAPAWLLVMALPNKTYHKELLAALRNERDIEE